MPAPIIGAVLKSVAAPAAGALLGGLFGGTKPTAQAAVPPDLMRVRRGGVNLLSQALANPQQAISRFGDLGVQQTGAQRQALGQMQDFFTAQNPFQQTIGAANAALQGMLTRDPSGLIMDALQPRFSRNLAEANQSGGRFGTANALLRSRALEDYNLLAAQAQQQGMQLQQQAAEMANLLGNDAVQRLGALYGMGAAQAQQDDIGRARGLDLMQWLTNAGLTAGLGQPAQMGPSGLQQGLQAGMGLLPHLLPYLFPKAGQQGGQR